MASPDGDDAAAHHRMVTSWKDHPQRRTPGLTVSHLFPPGWSSERNEALCGVILPLRYSIADNTPVCRDCYHKLINQAWSEDWLTKIFDRQKSLMRLMEDRERSNGSPVVNLDSLPPLDNRQVQARLHELFGYLVRELSEAMQHLKNKPWKTSHSPVNVVEFQEEMVDSFHFFIELCITAGMTPQMLISGYFKKAQTNVDRQGNGY